MKHIPVDIPPECRSRLLQLRGHDPLSYETTPVENTSMTEEAFSE